METVKVPMESLYEVILLQLQNGGKATLVVTGVSMKPMLVEHRDSVLLTPVTAKPKPGDIFLYRRESGSFVLHRLVGVMPEGYLFCGDNQCVRERVTQEQLLAIVSGFTRKGKQRSLKNPLYRIYVFMCVRLFFLRRTYIRLRRWGGRICRKMLKRRR